MVDDGTISKESQLRWTNISPKTDSQFQIPQNTEKFY